MKSQLLVSAIASSIFAPLRLRANIGEDVDSVADGWWSAQTKCAEGLSCNEGVMRTTVSTAGCMCPPEVAAPWQVVEAAKASVMPVATSYAAKIICPCECIGAARTTVAAATLALDAYLPRACVLQIGLMWPTFPQAAHTASLNLQSWGV